MVGPVQYLLYKSTVLALFGLYEILKRQPSIAPTRRDYEDCKQILILSLNPPHILKRPCKTSASTAVRRLALMGRAVSED